jgi:hypothetical protein
MTTRIGLTVGVLLLMAVSAQAQVKQSPRGIGFDCPITQPTPTEGVPESLLMDFYVCDATGANCAAGPEFTSPTGGLPVADPRLVHLPQAGQCEVNFNTIPYPIGKVYITKGRWVNSTGSSAPSSPTGPFTQPQPVPKAPANWRTVP